ncbi:MAG: hypothetical protein JWR21_3305 [Herminiimonas sp.]|nr:hypothetical protein [Herminiimonas sp.]
MHTSQVSFRPISPAQRHVNMLQSTIAYLWAGAQPNSSQAKAGPPCHAKVPCLKARAQRRAQSAIVRRNAKLGVPGHIDTRRHTARYVSSSGAVFGSDSPCITAWSTPARNTETKSIAAESAAAESTTEPTLFDELVDAYSYEAVLVSITQPLLRIREILVSTVRAGLTLPDIPPYFPFASGASSPVKDRAADRTIETMTVASFAKMYHDDFEMQASPLLQNEDLMEGVTIVIGEHHTDPLSKKAVARVMSRFRQERGDRLLAEGEVGALDEFSRKFSVPLNHIFSLEEDSGPRRELNRKFDEHYARQTTRWREVIGFVSQKSTLRDKTEIAFRAPDFSEFRELVSKHRPHMSKADQLEIDAKVRNIDLIEMTDTGTMIHAENSARESVMMKEIRKRTPTNRENNYVVLGAGHVINMATDIYTIKSVVMLSKIARASGARNEGGEWHLPLPPAKVKGARKEL